MRLTSFQTQQIKKSIVACFDKGAQVYLFGSRVDDHARGGDIDIFVVSKLGKKDAELARLGFVVDIQKRIGEQKIDVLVQASDADEQAIYAEAKRTGVLL